MTRRKPVATARRPLESRSWAMRRLVRATEWIEDRYNGHLDRSERRLGRSLDAAPLGTRHGILADKASAQREIYEAHGWVWTNALTEHRSNLNPSYTTFDYVKARQPTPDEVEAWHREREDRRHPRTASH